MIYLLVGHRARLPIVVRKEALLYYQIVGAVALGVDLDCESQPVRNLDLWAWSAALLNSMLYWL
jgi:hypothetical protein